MTKTVCFEGIDGLGKSTQVGLLATHLRDAGRTVLVSSYFSSPLVRDMLKRYSRMEGSSPEVGSIIIATEFFMRLERDIVPGLGKLDYVIFDRYIYTAFTRDALRGNRLEFLRAVYSGSPSPDIVIYLAGTSEMALSRKAQRLSFFECGYDVYGGTENAFRNFAKFENGCISQAEIDRSFLWFQDAVSSRYRMLEEYQGFYVVDSSLPVAELASAIRSRVDII